MQPGLTAIVVIVTAWCTVATTPYSRRPSYEFGFDPGKLHTRQNTPSLMLDIIIIINLLDVLLTRSLTHSLRHYLGLRLLGVRLQRHVHGRAVCLGDIPLCQRLLRSAKVPNDC